MRHIITATIATALLSLTCATSAIADQSAQAGLLDYTTVGSAAYQHSYGSTHARTQERTHAITTGDDWRNADSDSALHELDYLAANYRQAWKTATGKTLAPQRFADSGYELITRYYYTPANRVVPAYFAKHHAH
jgi:hypothetical protein